MPRRPVPPAQMAALQRKSCGPCLLDPNMNLSPVGHQHTLGVTRRELLQVGYSCLLGLGLPTLLAGRSLADSTKGQQSPGARRAKSVMLIFLTGAPSHLDTFD